MKTYMDNFATADHKPQRMLVQSEAVLTGAEAAIIRNAVNNCMQETDACLHIDTKNVLHADLGGINEIIHAAYMMQQTGGRLLLIYRSESVIAKWVETTGMDKFITTAILPAA